MATVSLNELRSHLDTARKHVSDCMTSDEDEPQLDFEAVRSSLRKALELLGEKSATSGTAADSARGAARLIPGHSVSGIFSGRHAE